MVGGVERGCGPLRRSGTTGGQRWPRRLPGLGRRGSGSRGGVRAMTTQPESSQRAIPAATARHRADEGEGGKGKGPSDGITGHSQGEHGDHSEGQGTKV